MPEYKEDDVTETSSIDGATVKKPGIPSVSQEKKEWSSYAEEKKKFQYKIQHT